MHRDHKTKRHPFVERVLRLTRQHVETEWETLQAIRAKAITEGWTKDARKAAEADAVLTAAILARDLDNISLSTLQRELRALGAQTPGEIIRDARLTFAKTLLDSTRISIREVAHRVGYQSEKQFAAAFARVAKTSPARYRAAESKEVAIDREAFAYLGMAVPADMSSLKPSYRMAVRSRACAKARIDRQLNAIARGDIIAAADVLGVETSGVYFTKRAAMDLKGLRHNDRCCYEEEATRSSERAIFGLCDELGIKPPFPPLPSMPPYDIEDTWLCSTGVSGFFNFLRVMRLPLHDVRDVKDVKEVDGPGYTCTIQIKGDVVYVLRMEHSAFRPFNRSGQYPELSPT